MKAFMKDEKFKDHFYIQNVDHLIWVPDTCKAWLEHVSELQELYYVLNYYLGLPKGGFQRRNFKIFNLAQYNWNIFLMLCRLTFVGNYSGTTVVTGIDNVRLHLPPKCVEDLILWFYYFVGELEKLLVKEFFPKAKPNWECYIYSSHGIWWKNEHLSAILKQESICYLNIGLDLTPLWHPLPAITEHYGIGIDCEHVSVHHTQHGKNLASCLYSQTVWSHPALTNDIDYKVKYFCDHWQKLLGFSSLSPHHMTEREMKHKLSPMQEQDSELASTFKKLIALLQDESETHRSNSGTQFHPAHKLLTKDYQRRPLLPQPLHWLHHLSIGIPCWYAHCQA